MKAAFKTSELKDELERALGFRLRTLERLTCVNALNFRAVRESDGFAFAVKCLSLSRQQTFDRLVRHLDELAGTKAAARIFRKECPPVFRGFNVICLSWCVGVRIYPDEQTEEQFDAFLSDYLEFSTALQRTTLILPPFPIADWRRIALSKCTGFWGRRLKGRVESAREAESDWQPDRLRVIHGDLHPGNLLFQGRRLSGFIDLEGFLYGYPAQDILRYFVFADEHLPWFAWRRRRRLRARFAQAVRRLPYPAGEWHTAVNECWLGKIWKKIGDGQSLSMSNAVRLMLRYRTYAVFRELVDQNVSEEA